MSKISIDQALLKAKSHAKKGEIDEAKNLYQSVLKAFPKNIRAQRGLAALRKHKQNVAPQTAPQEIIDRLLALYNKGHLSDVVEKAQILTEQYPDAFFVWNVLGAATKGLGRTADAASAFKRVTELNPTYADGFNNLGVTLKEQGKLDEAIAAYNKALSIKPDYAGPYNNMGTALQEQGKLDEAIAAYNKALSIKPDYAEAHRNLSGLIKYKDNDPQISSVDEFLRRTDLKDTDRCHLLYAFAKMNEDLGRFEAAYNSYAVGGALRKNLLAYDLRRDRALFAKIREVASSLNEFDFALPNANPPHNPIFIVGMPRSGTTLVEQIITCHSQVQGAGELELLTNLGGPIARGTKPLTSDSMIKLQVRYLDDLAKFSHGHQFVTDKMPQNFLYIALILKALPEAKIIHVKRNPAATCWSNFKHYFSATGLGYSYDLSDTVQYFNLYQDLMNFWDDLYPDQIYHLDYDRLTVEQELETRQLVEHLGLNWEDACLSPHENKRSVRTVSQQQVRKKIYSGSSEAWRKFEPYLNGAFDELRKV